LLSNLLSDIPALLLSLPVVLLALTVHETAHGYVAYKLGDTTARDLGRLTLNPLKHLNPLGFLSMLIVGFGWANPVPINTRNFKNPRVGMAIAGIAGPVSNFLIAAVSLFLSMLLQFILILSGVEQPHILIEVLDMFLFMSTYLNLALAVFNLIPVPPFDGSRFAYVFLPTKWYFKVMEYERITGIVLIVILMLLSRIGISPVSIVVEFLMNLMGTLFALPLNLILNAIM
jgi:Zn-dependent protease